MHIVNLAVSLLLVVIGLLFTLLMWTQDPGWNIGVAIGIVLLLNGLVRFVFALGDVESDDMADQR